MSDFFTGDFDLSKIMDLITPAVSSGMAEAADDVMDDSDANVPVLTGALKRSRRIKLSGTKADYGYSDPSAVAAHENMRVRYRNGKKAKFLELAQYGRKQSFQDTLARHIRRVIG